MILISFIIKKFVKNYEDIKNPEVRNCYILLLFDDIRDGSRAPTPRYSEPRRRHKKRFLSYAKILHYPLLSGTREPRRAVLFSLPKHLALQPLSGLFSAKN